MQLRPYQQQAIEAVYRHLRQHDDNPVVVLPTGSGKTPVMSTICRDAVQRWDGRVIVLAHVKELLEQTATTLQRIEPDLPVGVYSAGLGRREADAPVLVAGIQSVCRRACELDPVDLAIVDEAHMIPPEMPTRPGWPSDCGSTATSCSRSSTILRCRSRTTWPNG